MVGFKKQNPCYHIWIYKSITCHIQRNDCRESRKTTSHWALTAKAGKRSAFKVPNVSVLYA